MYRDRVVLRISANLPDNLAAELNERAARLKRSRADIVRHAIECYLDDLDDLEAAAERLEDSNDPWLDWSQVRRELADTN